MKVTAVLGGGKCPTGPRGQGSFWRGGCAERKTLWKDGRKTSRLALPGSPRGSVLRSETQQGSTEPSSVNTKLALEGKESKTGRKGGAKRTNVLWKGFVLVEGREVVGAHTRLPEELPVLHVTGWGQPSPAGSF